MEKGPLKGLLSGIVTNIYKSENKPMKEEIEWKRNGNEIVPVDIIGKPQEWFIFTRDNELPFEPWMAKCAREEKMKNNGDNNETVGFQ